MSTHEYVVRWNPDTMGSLEEWILEADLSPVLYTLDQVENWISHKLINRERSDFVVLRRPVVPWERVPNEWLRNNGRTVRRSV